MTSTSEIGKRLKETEVKQRREFLILNLRKMGVYEAKHGGRLEDLRLAELEWMYIEARNDKLREEMQLD